MVNGVLVNGAIEVAVDNADSYSVMYNGGGQATAHVLRKTENSVVQTLVTLSSYDLRGNRLYEFHPQVLGGAYAGIAKQFTVDALGQTLATRSYYANGTIKQTLVPTGGPEPEAPEDVDVSGWLSDAETLQYDGDGRAVMQAVYKRGLQGRENIQAAGNQYADIALLRLQNRVDYTQSDGSNAWTDTDLSNNASGYDALGRLTTYRYSARNPNGPDWYTHTFTSTYEGWESWQEKTVAGVSTNSTFKPTTNTLHLDAYGRILKQQETTVGASIDDRVRVYTYSGDGMVQTRREGTVNGSNVFTQSTKAPNNTPQNYQFVYAGGQQLAELQAGGEVRTALPTGGGRFSQQTAQAIYAASGAGNQTNSLSKLVGGSGPYTAGGGMATVLEGETLQSLAQRVYGTSTLWYVLADANGYSDPAAPLTAGVQLKTPSVGVNSNDANTFRPYNPNEAIGSTSPGLPFIPPAKDAGCNSLVMIIMVVVAIVVTIYTAGAASSALAASQGAVAGAAGTTATVGGAALTGGTIGVTAGGATISLTAAGAVGVGAVAGAAGAAASLAVGSLMGGATFSWRGVAAGAITGGLTAGIATAAGGSISQLMAGGWANTGKIAASALGNAAAGYAGNRLAGVSNTSFSWKSIAASAVSSVATAGIGELIGLKAPKAFGGSGSFTDDFAQGMIGGAVNLHVRRAFGFDDKVDYGSIAANAAGTAIGNALVRGLSSPRSYQSSARVLKNSDGLNAVSGDLAPLDQVLYDMRRELGDGHRNAMLAVEEANERLKAEISDPSGWLAFEGDSNSNGSVKSRPWLRWSDNLQAMQKIAAWEEELRQIKMIMSDRRDDGSIIHSTSESHRAPGKTNARAYDPSAKPTRMAITQTQLDPVEPLSFNYDIGAIDLSEAQSDLTY